MLNFPEAMTKSHTMSTKKNIFHKETCASKVCLIYELMEDWLSYALRALGIRCLFNTILNLLDVY